MAGTWRTARVFISSTFRDMHAERDHLVKIVFPELRERLLLYRVYLDDIDLRWGITEEEAMKDKVLDLCLQQIDECRPFFIGILGERYGWVPTTPLSREAARRFEKYGKTQFETGQSVTELEILFGVLLMDPQMIKRSFFYFRDPRFLNTVPSDRRREVRHQFQEFPTEEEIQQYGPKQARREAAIRRLRLRRLKQKIRAVRKQGYPVFEHYPSRWDPEAFDRPTKSHGRLVDLNEFGRQIGDQLWEAIQAEFELLYEPTAPSGLDEAAHLSAEADDQARFVESRLRVYVGREDVQRALVDYALGNEPMPCLVTGPSGSGKSAALAKFVDRAKNDLPGLPVIAHFIGASPRSTALRDMLKRLCSELYDRVLKMEKEIRLAEITATGEQANKQRQAIEHEFAIPEEIAPLVTTWRRFLMIVPEPHRVVIVLDALNQLEEGERARELWWLPRDLGSHVKVIASCIVDPEFDEAKNDPVARVFRHRPVCAVRIGGLAPKDRERILREVPSLSAKTLDEKQVRMLLENPGTENPLYLRVALEELRGFGSFEDLNDRIAALPRPGLEDAIYGRAKFSSVAMQRAGDSVTALFTQVIQRLESEFASGLVHDILTMLAAARRGLSEREIQEFLENRPDAVDLFPALRQLRPYLARRTGLLGFNHPGLLQAVQRYYLDTAEKQGNAHRQLAERFAAQNCWLLSFEAQPERSVATDEPSNVESTKGPDSGQFGRFLLGVWRLFRDPLRNLFFGPHHSSVAQKRWQGLSASSRSANLRKVDELPWQRLRAEQWDELERLLTDLEFVEAKCSAGMTYDLLADYAAAIPLLPGAGSRRLAHTLRAVQSEHHLLASHPECTFQQVYDHLQWIVADEPILGEELRRSEKRQNARQQPWVRNELRRESRDRTLAGHDSSVNCCSFNFKYSILATGGDDGTVRLWTVADGKCVGVLPTGGPVASITCDETGLVVARIKNGSLVAYRSDEREKVLHVPAADDPVRDMALGVNGRLYAKHESGGVTIWECGTRKLLNVVTPDMSPVRSIADGPDDIFFLGGKNQVGVYDGARCRALWTVDGDVWTMRYAPEDRILAVQASQNVLIFDLSDSAGCSSERKSSRVLPRYGYWVGTQDLAWGPGRRLLWIRRRPHIYDETTGLCTATLHQSTDSGLRCGCFVGRDVLALGREDGRIQICDVPPTEPASVFVAGDSPVVACFADSVRGDTIAVLKNGKVVVQGVGGRREIAVIPNFEGEPICATFAAERRSVAIGTTNGSVHQLDMGQSQPLRKLYSHKRAVLCLRYSPNQSLLASSSYDRSIIVYESVRNVIVATLARHRRRVVSIAWHANSRHLFSTATDRTIRVWDAIKGSELVTAKHCGFIIGSLCESKDSSELAACRDDGQIQRFKIHGFWNFLYNRSRYWYEWRLGWGNSRDAFDQAAVFLPVEMPAGPKPRNYGEVLHSQCEYLDHGLILYTWGSHPAVLLDMENEDVVLTPGDDNLLKNGEEFSTGFSLDRIPGTVLRGTTAGRVFCWKLPDAYQSGASAVRGTVSALNLPRCASAPDGNSISIDWGTGVVTALEIRPLGRPRSFAIDSMNVAGAGIVVQGEDRYLVAARRTGNNLREMLFATDLVRETAPIEFSDPAPEYVGGRRAPVIHLRTSPQDDAFALVQENGACSLWSPLSRGQKYSLGTLPRSEPMKDGDVVSVFSEDGRYLVVLTSEGEGAVWDLNDTGRRFVETVSYRGDKRSYTSVRWLTQKRLPIVRPVGTWIIEPEGILVVLSADGRAVTCKLDSLRLDTAWATGLPLVRHVSNYHREADALFVGDGSRKLALLHLKRGSAEVGILDESSSIRASAIVGNNPLRLAVAADPNKIQFWDAARNYALGVYWATDPVVCLEPSPIEDRCFAVDRRGSVLLLRLCGSRVAFGRE
jgi:WD40 repeat protein